MKAWRRKLLQSVRSRSSAHLDSPQQPCLTSLPAELLQQIVDFLDPSDTACLLLCNRTILYKLGTSAWDSLRICNGRKKQRQDFLIRLDQDSPADFFCFTCLCLHPLISVGPPSRNLRPSAPRRSLCSSRQGQSPAERSPSNCFAVHVGGTQYQLAFEHLQVAMARHRQNASNATALEWLCFKEVQVSSFFFDITTLLSVEPRIIADELCLRIQQWIMFKTDKVSEVPTFRILGICNHASSMTYRTMPDLIRCKLSHEDCMSSCPTCRPFLKCVVCSTEFEIESFHYGYYKGGLVVTKWLNLGHGNTPTDPLWRRHLTQDIEWREPALPFVETDRESGLRGVFERQEGKSQDLLMDENEAILLQERFRKSFKRVPAESLFGEWQGQDDAWVKQVNLAATPKSTGARFRRASVKGAILSPR